jgi:hypothetical protein
VKAIVVRQPWATLIALGVKTIETRPSPPNGPMRPEGVRGLPGCSLERGERIAIVAGATPGTAPGEDLGDSGWYWESTAGDPSCVVNWKQPVKFHPAPLGAVVCTVTVDDALPIVGNPEDSDECLYPDDHGGLWRFLDAEDVGFPMSDQLPLGDFTPGRWGWLLGNPQPCDPIPCKGRQGVFTLPDDVAHQLADTQIGGAS